MKELYWKQVKYLFYLGHIGKDTAVFFHRCTAKRWVKTEQRLPLTKHCKQFLTYGVFKTAVRWVALNQNAEHAMVPLRHFYIQASDTHNTEEGNNSILSNFKYILLMQ